MLCLIAVCFFFFSSRRRHTRLVGDWSSDVCSSDLRSVRSEPGGSHGPLRPAEASTKPRVTSPSRLEHRACRHRAGLEIPPQLHQQPARQGHDPDPPDAAAALAKPLLVPPAQRALRLKPQPPPGDLDRHRPDVTVACLGDPLFPAQLATLIGRRRQPRQPADLAPVAKLPPPEKLHHIQPRAVRPNPPEPEQASHQLHRRRRPTPQLLRPLPLQLLDLPREQRHFRPLPRQPRPQAPRQGGPIPQPQILELPQQPGVHLDPHPLVREQPLHPVRHPGPIPLGRQQLPVELSLIFLRHRRDVHHPPGLPLARPVAHHLQQQLPHIQSIRLRPPPAPVHLDARRVHHVVLDPAGHQIPMQPEPLTACLVAAHHAHVRREPEALLRPLDLCEQGRHVPRRDGALPRPLPQTRGEPQLPRRLAQLSGIVYARSEFFQSEKDPSSKKRVVRGYYFLDELQTQGDGSARLLRRFWFNRVNSVQFARLQTFDEHGALITDVSYADFKPVGDPGVTLPTKIGLTRPQDHYQLSLTYQSPESVVLDRPYPADVFQLENKWNLPEVDLDAPRKP